ncbi:hypothetical protein [Paraburkholderia sacchari]|uniref:hypothetical protein n=1 Tax=Paraburkholderia sacchari TaxID=159450 RepID=UPI0039A4482C
MRLLFNATVLAVAIAAPLAACAQTGASTSGSSQTGQRAEITVSPYSPPIEVIGH